MKYLKLKMATILRLSFQGIFREILNSIKRCYMHPDCQKNIGEISKIKNGYYIKAELPVNIERDFEFNKKVLCASRLSKEHR